MQLGMSNAAKRKARARARAQQEAGAETASSSSSDSSSSSKLPTSFLESNFRTKVEFEASQLLPEPERLAAEEAAAAKHGNAAEASSGAAVAGAAASRQEVAAQAEARRAEVEAEVRKQVAAKVAEARRAQAQAEKEQQAADTKPKGPRKLTEKELLGMEISTEKSSNRLDMPEVKDYRMQGNYGATKFIKP